MVVYLNMEVSEAAEQLTLKHLWFSASALNLRSYNHENLLPVISQLRQNIVNRSEGTVAFDTFQASDVCQYCGSLFSESKFKLKILHHSQRMKKLRTKYIQKQTTSSKYSKNLLSMFMKWKDNILLKECGVCLKKVKIGLTKPSHKKTEQLDSSLLVENIPINKKKRKRKSKKDRFSGLLPSAVVNARFSLRTEDSVNNTSVITSQNTSVFSDVTLQSETNLEDSVCEEHLVKSNSKIVEQVQQKNILSAKKRKPETNVTLNTNNSKKNKKKKKKSLVSDFLKII